MRVRPIRGARPRSTAADRARHGRVAAWLALAVFIAILLAAGLARADLRGAPAPVAETSCEMSVHLRGPIVQVSERHHITTSSEAPVAAAYDAMLPAGAVLDGFVVDIAGRQESGVVVPPESLDNHTPPSLGLAPDPAALRLHATPAGRLVEIDLYPVGNGGITGFTLRWSVPATYADGLMSVVLPARGAGDNLARCRVRVDTSPGTGIRTWSGVRAGGVYLGSGARVRGAVTGVAPAEPFTIDARPTWSRATPVLATAYGAPLATPRPAAATARDAGGRDRAAATPTDGRIPATIAIYAPDTAAARRAAPSRLLFVIDMSRSVGDDGRRAAAATIEALARAARAGTTVEAIVFDRRARRVISSWQPVPAGLPLISRAVRESPVAGGSDLSTALALAAATIGDEGAHVVVITDGVLPRSQSATELLGAFAVTAGKTTLDILVPLAAGAASPDRTHLSTLAHLYGGRVLVFPADAPPAASALDEGTGAGAPLTALRIEADGDDLAAVSGADASAVHGDAASDVAIASAPSTPAGTADVGPDAGIAFELPDVLAAGSGLVLTTTLPRKPRRLVLHARSAQRAVTAPALPLPAGAERFAIAAASLPPIDPEVAGGRTGGRFRDPDATSVVAAAAARRLGIVAPGGAMLVIDRRAASGASRHDAARRTGAVTYTEPPRRLPSVLAATSPASGAGAPSSTAPLARGTSGELPRSSVQLALRDQLVPTVRRCYAAALRASPQLAGRLVVELEIARGEVMAVELGGDHFPEEMVGCVAEAAFAMTTPRYELGGEADTIFVVRKPIEFRAPAAPDAEPTVSLDDVLHPTKPSPSTIEVEPDVPL